MIRTSVRLRRFAERTRRPPREGRLPTSVIVVMLIVLVGSLGLPPSWQPSAKGQRSLRFVESAEHPLASWARDRFRSIGESLPEITFAIHGEKEPCDGNSGLARLGRPARVDLCLEPDDPEIAFRRVVLHEFAHVWAEDSLDEGDRAAFVELRRSESWSDGSYENQAREQAADIIAWGLIDRPLRLIIQGPCEPADLVAAFRMLTGHDPISPTPTSPKSPGDGVTDPSAAVFDLARSGRSL